MSSQVEKKKASDTVWQLKNPSLCNLFSEGPPIFRQYTFPLFESGLAQWLTIATECGESDTILELRRPCMFLPSYVKTEFRLLKDGRLREGEMRCPNQQPVVFQRHRVSEAILGHSDPDELPDWLQKHDCSQVRPTEELILQSPAKIANPRTHEQKNCCFKLPTFGVICYTAKDNW